MSKVCLFGCGNVGMAAAHEIAMKAGFIEELVLCDIDKDKAFGEALDLSHTMTFTQNVLQIKAGGYKDACGAEIVIITAGKNQKKGQTRLELFKDNALIVCDIVKNCEKVGFNGIYVIATNPVDLVTLSIVKKCKIDAQRVIGTGTMLDTARLKCLLGGAININPKDINAFVLGEHGDSEMVAWSSADIAGASLNEKLFDNDKKLIEDKVKNSAYEIINSKGYTNFGVGACIYELVKSIICNENAILSVSTYHGKDNMAYSMPTIVGKCGIINKICPQLNDEEKNKLSLSIEKLTKAYKEVFPLK